MTINWDKVKELLKVNFLYANPQVFAQVRAKQAKKPNKKFSALKSIRNQFLILSLLFFCIYSSMFIGIDYRQSAGYFSVQLGLFSLIALATGFNSLFSVFYDSKDTKLYQSLPVSSEEVYLAKLLSAQPAVLTYLLPLLSLIGIAYWQISSPVTAILLTLPIFFLLLLTINAISLFLLDLIGGVLVKSRHKKLIASSLVMLSTLLSIGLIYVIQFTSSARYDGTGGVLMIEIPYFIGFYQLVTQPFGLASLLNFWLPLAILIGLLIYIIKAVIPNYFNQLLQMDVQQAVTKKRASAYKDRSLNQTLIRHHLGTLKDGTLLTQAYLMPMILGFSGLMPLIARGVDLSDLSSGYYGIALVIGLLFGLLTTGATSLLSVGISLERENLTFIRSLPINLTAFLKSKFHTLLVVQVGPILLLHLLAGGLGFHLSPALLLAYGLGNITSSYLMGLFMYRRDYRLLDLNWQNVTQLFSRGNGQWLLALFYLLLMIGGGAIIVFSVILASTFSPQTVSFVLLLVSLVSLGVSYWFVGRGFWTVFDNN